ncbi:MAG: SDR family oxidoreductase [Gammaproteobacteria bacterium]|nr:SDR family oxidoreductase [Gammaproteobacteria bacterium]MCP5200189.1 SDR family oxidoreductase [Gammaproteobacteria bacterium]
MDLGLKDQAVIVTGGASNIGRAIVLGFAREGAKVMIGDIDAAQAGIVAEEARAAGAAAVAVAACDVTDLSQVQAMFKQAQDAFGGVDVLVNNVGWDSLMFFTQTTPDLWERIIRVNFVGVLNCTYTALAIMAPQNKGAIVSISSDASRQGEPREAVYGGMKAGINSFMKTIAKENGRNGIRCNVVCPGVTIPEADGEVGANSMWVDKDSMFTAEQLEKVAKALPLKKIGRPGDVANAVVFLASAAAGHVTGQVLSVSGGYSMIG